MGASTRSTAAGTPDAQSAVTSVVVHSSGAVCTRLARFDPAIRDGAATVRVVGLPPTLFEHSLRGRVVAGPPGLRVADVRLDVGATLRRGDELPGQRLDLEDAEDRRSRLRDRRDRLTAEIGEVAAFRAEPPVPRRGDPPRWAPVESILALAGFIDSRLALLHQRLRAAEDELAQAEHDVDVLRHRMDEASSALGTDRVQPSVAAVVTLALDTEPDGAGTDGDRRWTTTVRTATDGRSDSSADASTDSADAAGDEAQSGAVTVELEYHVPGATWAPVYQLRLDGRTGAGTLVLRAGVAQRTAEDWTGVRLGLSTADLLRRPTCRSCARCGSAAARRSPGPRAGASPRPGWRNCSPATTPPRPPAPATVQPRAVDQLPPAMERQSFGPASQLPVAGRPPLPTPAAAPAPGAGGPFEDDQDGYGGAPGGYASISAPAQPAPARRSAASRGKARAHHSVRQPHAPGGPPQDAPPAEAFASAPSADLLDYARLTMTGPDAADGRGTLRPGSGGTPALVTEYRRRAEAVAGLERPAHAVDVRAAAGSFDYRFDTAVPVDVEADGQWHTVPVSEVPVSTEFAYVCVPSVDQSVFGTVLVTNTSAHALLAGPVDVMVDGDFVLTAALPTLAPGQRQAVGVGVAESVRVVRRAHMRESTAGLRGGTTVLDHTVEVEVANRLPIRWSSRCASACRCRPTRTSGSRSTRAGRPGRSPANRSAGRRTSTSAAPGSGGSSWSRAAPRRSPEGSRSASPWGKRPSAATGGTEPWPPNTRRRTRTSCRSPP